MSLFARRLATVIAAVVLASALVVPAGAVVGGRPAATPPWLVAVGTPSLLVRPSGQFCGGVLVAPDKVATAAHCVDFLRDVPNLLSVTFGRADLTGHGGETVPVTQIWVSPGFHETTFKGVTVEHDDVAVLTLQRPVIRIRLPLVPPGGTYLPGTPARVLGWGTTSEQDLVNARLREATVQLVPDERCAAAYGHSFDPREMICAGSSKAATCQFDGGGPLVVAGRLTGLASWAYGCARPGFPGVYTRLSAVTLPLL